MAETELRPCPFCGAKPALVGGRKWFVMCPNQRCAAEGPLRVSSARASTAWNRRATDPAVAELVEALRRALPSVQSDAEMMDAIDRHNPLPAADMPAVTKAANELDVLVDDIRALLAKHAAKP